MISTPSPASAISAGCSTRHGAHQEAKKLTRTGRPARAALSIDAPASSRLATAIAGAIWPKRPLGCAPVSRRAMPRPIAPRPNTTSAKGHIARHFISHSSICQTAACRKQFLARSFRYGSRSIRHHRPGWGAHPGALADQSARAADIAAA